MTIAHITGLLGGLALFLYGMQMMSDGLEAAAGNRMKRILERLTSNRFLGVLVGAVITAVIQSSSATTVMAVGFVNSGMMTLGQAVWIIMGANIGTTITGQLIALDIGAMAPFIAFVGVAVVVFIKNDKLRHIGTIFAGLGILFIGMDMMGTSMKPLAEIESFVELLTRFSNPILGILAGLVFTALIQSSSASVGILQALAKSGAIGLEGAAFVLFGQNIGTCVTALLASIGTSRNAKRTTVVHISFNVVGTIIFTVLALSTPLISWVQSWTDNPSAQIANLHTMFNIVTTCLLLPVGTLLPKLATFILPDKVGENKEKDLRCLLHIHTFNPEKIGGTAIAMADTKKELERMLGMARENVHNAFHAFYAANTKLLEEIECTEEYVDYLNKEITKYITTMMTHESTISNSQVFSAYFSITGNIERMSDHAMNIAGYSKLIAEKGIHFSAMAKQEIKELQAVCDELFALLFEKTEEVIGWHEKVACLEQKMDDITEEYRNSMLERIQNGSCTDEGSILFSEMLTDFERIGDHGLNISNEMVKIAFVQH